MIADPVYCILFDEARHALSELRQQKYHDAEKTLEGLILAATFLGRYRARDPQSLRMARFFRLLDWEETPEGRLAWERGLIGPELDAYRREVQSRWETPPCP